MRTLCLALVVAALLVVGCGGPRIDPKWEEAATNYLNDVEILAKFNPTDLAGVKERRQRVEESLIKVPKSDVEPAATLRTSLNRIAGGCNMLARQAESLPLGVVSREDLDRIETELETQVDRVRAAIAKGESYLIPDDHSWLKK